MNALVYQTGHIVTSAAKVPRERRVLNAAQRTNGGMLYWPQRRSTVFALRRCNLCLVHRTLARGAHHDFTHANRLRLVQRKYNGIGDVLGLHRLITEALAKHV